MSLDKQKRETLTERIVLVLCLYCYKYSLKDQMISNLRLCPGVRLQASNVLRKCYITETLCDAHLPLLQEVDKQCNRRINIGAHIVISKTKNLTLTISNVKSN